MSAPVRAEVPDWLTRLQRQVDEVPEQWVGRLSSPTGGARASAVLILFGPGREEGEELVLIERSHGLRSHPGQIAFPGGGYEEQDADLVQTALREAAEEIDLDPTGVQVLGQFPAVHIPVSRYDVTPVLAWWEHPSAVRVHDPNEVEDVLRVPVGRLTDPRNRLRARYRGSPWVGPAFDLDGRLLWGFTAAIVDGILDLAGLSRPWDPSQVREVG